MNHPRIVFTAINIRYNYNFDMVDIISVYHQLFAFFEINSGGGTSFPDFLRILLYINSGICCGLCLGIVMSR